MNIKEHSGKRYCKKQINKNLFFFIRVVFKGPPPLPQLGLWTFEPAFSPRFSFPLSPRSFFHTRQRFPNSNHVTSGCMSPRSTFDQWSAVSHTGNDMTSSSDHVIALDQSGASICPKRAHCTTPGRCYDG